MTDEFTYREAFYAEPRGRDALNAFAAVSFPGLQFEPWNTLAPRENPYTPFSYFDGDRVVANVSASPMNLVIDGRDVAAVQVGTVATAPALRRRGLIRRLIARAHAHWETHAEFFYLFTGPPTVDFYRQFGYRRVTEFAFTAPLPPHEPSADKGRRLDLARDEDRDLLRRLTAARAPVSRRLGVHRQNWLVLYHAATLYPDCLFYLERFDLVLIARRDGDRLDLVDVIGPRIPPLADLLPHLETANAGKILFGFTPDLWDPPGVQMQPDVDTLLMVRGPFALEGKEFRFQLTSPA
jgi:GNAT superfamily N-acetyltransferase